MGVYLLPLQPGLQERWGRVAEVASIDCTVTRGPIFTAWFKSVSSGTGPQMRRKGPLFWGLASKQSMQQDTKTFLNT